MPKSDYLRRMDQPVAGGVPAQPAPVTSQPSGMAADMVDGYHASLIPKPYHIPVLDKDGVLFPETIPAAALDGDQAHGHHGIQYIGSTTYLAEAIEAADTEIRLRSPSLANGDRIVMSHYSVPVEHMYVLGGPERDGRHYVYSVNRERNDPRLGYPTTAQKFPRGAQVISMGGPGSGHMFMVSSASDEDPYIEVRDNNTDQSGDVPFSTTWKTQIGWLGNLPSWFTDLFPDHTDWEDTWGFAGYDGFFAGTMYALGGNIAGTMSVDGMLRVKDPNSNAVAEIGHTAGGFGYVLRNQQGRPVWIATTAYTDADGNYSDVAWIVESYGDRAIYFRHDEDLEDWILSIGGFDVHSDHLFAEDTEGSSQADFKIVPSEGKIYWGSSYIGSSGAQIWLSENTWCDGDFYAEDSLATDGDVWFTNHRKEIRLYGHVQAAAIQTKYDQDDYTRYLSFYDEDEPIAKQTITGARDDPTEALADLLSKLDDIGLFTDGTTAT